MKTERRHELQTNELADWLGKQIAGIRPYSKTILGVVVLIVAAIVALMLSLTQRSRNVAGGWQAYYDATVARNAEKLSEIAKDYEGTTAGLWATQSAGDAYLMQGTSLLHIDRDDAADRLNKARAAYQQVIDQTYDDLLKPRALIGLAQCYEARNEVEEAEKQYNRVIEGWPETSLAKLAKERRDLLAQASTREFLNWFDDQEPQLPPVSGTPGAADPFGGMVPGSENVDDVGAGLPFGTLEPPSDSSGDAASSGPLLIQPGVLPSSGPSDEASPDGEVKDSASLSDILGLDQPPSDDAAGAENEPAGDPDDDSTGSPPNSDGAGPSGGDESSGEGGAAN